MVIPIENYAVVDGGCNNQKAGTAYGSFALFKQGEEIYHSPILTFPELITSNQAEYQAMLYLLTYLIEHYPQEQWVIYNDSDLIRLQLTQVYKVHDLHLKPMYELATDLITQLKVRFVHMHNQKVKQILGH